MPSLLLLSSSSLLYRSSWAGRKRYAGFKNIFITYFFFFSFDYFIVFLPDFECTTSLTDTLFYYHVRENTIVYERTRSGSIYTLRVFIFSEPVCLVVLTSSVVNKYVAWPYRPVKGRSNAFPPGERRDP